VVGRKARRITNTESFIVGAGWRPWTFVKIDTSDGITGWGECSDGRSPHGVVGTIQDLTPLLIGQDPRADVFMIDVPWNGFSQSKKIGDLAEVYQLNPLQGAIPRSLLRSRSDTSSF
jgi:L-alanine-DL-glutamate epimerase-like enolase superfamily enzyme